MFKKLILVAGFIFLFSFNLAQATGVVINEFVSNPNTDEKEWVELLNTTGNSIDLIGWTIQDLTFSGINITGSHDNVIGSVTILANSIVSIDVTGLNNGGDSISLYDSTSSLVSRVTYGNVANMSADLDYPIQGKSGAFISGVWETDQEPTQGEANKTEVAPPPADDSGNSSSPSSTTEPETKPKVIENPTMKVKILANALAFTGQPFEIKTNVSGFSGENIVLGRASWNFGDGSSFEQINNFEKFSHTYYYPGEYVLFLEYYQNSFSKTPEATSKMIIKVLPTSVFISKVGDAKDFFIELSNNASSDIDISNWVINANGKIFTLPKNSVIMSKKQVTVSSKITGFNYSDKNNLKLYSGTGELVFDYNIGTQPPKSTSQNITGGQALSSTSSPDKGRLGGVVSTDLQSNVISSAIGNSYMPFIPIASIIFIGASAGVVYFIRRKKVIPKDGDDFEILDE